MWIKAISLWQPWASLVAVGAKKYETRSWKTDYRGPLLICASKRKPDILATSIAHHAHLKEILNCEVDKLPLGKAVAIVDLINCAPAAVVREMLEPYGQERIFGDFTPGRWAWALNNIRVIEPFSVIGRQGLFEIQIDMIDLIPNKMEKTLCQESRQKSLIE